MTARAADAPRLIRWALLALCVLMFIALLVTPAGAWLLSPLGRTQRIGQVFNAWANLIPSGLAFFLAFRLRQFPIGAEASALTGGFFAWFAALLIPAPPALRLPIALLTGAVAGAAVLAFACLLKIRFTASELLVTLMLAKIMPLLLQTIFPGLLQMLAGPVRRPFDAADGFVQLPRIVTLTGLEFGVMHMGIFLSVLVWVAAVLLLDRSTFGFAVRAVGANAKFAHYGGVRVTATLTGAYVVMGALMALPGMYSALGGSFGPFVATPSLAAHGIFVAVLARGRVWRVLPVALVYAYLLVVTDLIGLGGSVGQDVLLMLGAAVMLALGVGSKKTATG
jgi:general nucleoside transport system permease protein